MNDTVQTQPAQAEEGFLPGPVLLLGAPGVGKGTQAQILMGEFGIPQISTGDILRQNIASGSELGVRAKGLMDQGLLVDDETVNGMVALRISDQDTVRGFILDGFPRTSAQADWLDAQDRHFLSRAPLVAIEIKVDRGELLHRITGRRICPTCKSIYNVYSNAPKVEGVCDLDGSSLQHRSDDTEEAFARRMEAYESLTRPVIEHYAKGGTRGGSRFATVDGSGSLQEVANRVKSELHALRSRFPSDLSFQTEHQ